MKAGGAPDGGALDYRIDATEVTTEQYDTFVKSYNANPFAQRDVCWWNHSVKPNDSPPNDAGIGPSVECQSYDFSAEVIAHPNAPVRCVDWCDAATYCKWAGGWMCHGNEGVNTYLPEWETACRGPNGHKFPYGDTFQTGACVDKSVGMQPLDVHSKATCQGGYSGIFDMSGNVAEWVDCGCEYDNGDSTTTSAFVGGGGFKDSDDAVDCTPARMEGIISFHVDVGIRCCYPP
jgi:formylglycine-generating enzyme required for sulfatase activity